MGGTLLDDWSDVWSEYRKTYRQYGITHEAVALSVTSLVADRMARPDLDKVADALKEHAILAQCRGVPAVKVVDHLSSPRDMDHAVRLFGTAAEDLGLDALGLLVTLVGRR